VAAATAKGRSKCDAALACWKRAQATVDRTLGRQRADALHLLLDEAIDLLAVDAP